MLNLNHTLFPTFYGCYEENVPLVLCVCLSLPSVYCVYGRVSLYQAHRYAADAPYTAYSNISATARCVPFLHITVYILDQLRTDSQLIRCLQLDQRTIRNSLEQHPIPLLSTAFSLRQLYYRLAVLHRVWRHLQVPQTVEHDSP